jgi:hypothetical protein
LLSRAEFVEMKLETARAKVVAKDEEWSALLDRTTGDAVAKELELYKDASESYQPFLMAAEDLIAFMTIHIDIEIEKKDCRIESSVSSTSYICWRAL